MTTPPDDPAYLDRVAADLERWRSRKPSKALQVVNKPFEIVGMPIAKAMELEPVQAVVRKALGVATDVGAWTVPTSMVVARYRALGYPVENLADIRAHVPFEVIDRQVRAFRARYTAAGAAEGTVAGFGTAAASSAAAAAAVASGGAAAPAGAAAAAAVIAADVVLIATLSCRIVADYATWYGVDVTQPERQHEALLALSVGTAASTDEKADALAEVGELRALLVKRQKWSALEEKAVVKGIRKIAERFGYRLTQARLARAVTIVGAAFGGAFNAAHLNKIADAAYMLNRESLLAERRPASGPPA
jgi:EcsC family protein